MFERGNEEGEWQTGSVSTEQKGSLERLHKYLRHTLDDHECDVGVRGDSASGTFHVVFRQAFGLGKHQHSSDHCQRPLETHETHLIAPPTNCPRFRATIHKARYFPRAPAGASDMIVPASATYHSPLPVPVTKPPKIRYH